MVDFFLLFGAGVVGYAWAEAEVEIAYNEMIGRIASEERMKLATLEADKAAAIIETRDKKFMNLKEHSQNRRL